MRKPCAIDRMLKSNYKQANVLCCPQQVWQGVRHLPGIRGQSDWPSRGLRLHLQQLHPADHRQRWRQARSAVCLPNEPAGCAHWLVWGLLHRSLDRRWGLCLACSLTLLWKNTITNGSLLKDIFKQKTCPIRSVLTSYVNEITFYHHLTPVLRWEAIFFELRTCLGPPVQAPPTCFL